MPAWWSPLVVVLVASVGLAQPQELPTPPPLESAEEPDEAAPQWLLPPGITASDDPLLTALRAIFAEADEEERVARVQALAALGDERAAEALAYFARRDRSVKVRAAAAEGLGGVRSEIFEKLAEALLEDPGVSAEVRSAAARALAMQGTPSGAQALTRIIEDPGTPRPVRQATLEALRTHHPHIAAKLVLPERHLESSGTLLGTLVGAASGAYTLALVGSLSQNEGVGTTVGAFGGLVVGGAGAYLLGRNVGLTNGDALLLGSAAAWSVPVGWLYGGMTGGADGGCDKGCNAVALGTHVAAMGASWLAKDTLRLTPPDALEVNFGAFSGLFVSLGLVTMLPSSGDVRPGLFILGLGPTAGFIGAAAFADRLQLSPQMAGLLLFSGAELALVGGMLASALMPEDFPRRGEISTGWALAGAGLGMGGALVASAFWDPSPSEVLLLAFAAMQGNLVGAAVPLLAVGDSEGGAARPAALGTALGGLAAATAVGLLTRRLELQLDVGDVLLVSLGTAFAAWHGIGWSIWLNDRGILTDDARSVGLALGTAGLGSAALLAASQHLALTPSHAASLYSGAVWGGWLGYWSSYILTEGDSDHIRLSSSLVSSAVGLGVSALMLSPVLEVPPSSLAWISVFGVTGMTLSSMVAVFVAWDAPGKPVATANVIGTVVGLGVGALAAPHLNRLLGSGRASEPARALGSLPLPLAVATPHFDRAGRVDGYGGHLLWLF
jgi:hypothetical protein